MKLPTKAESIELAWRSYPRVEWDLETPLAVIDQPVILYTPDEVANFCLAANASELWPLPRFVLCERIPAPYISPLDVLSDWLDLSAPVPDAVQVAFDALNKSLSDQRVDAWVPSFTAVTLPEAFLEHLAASGNRVATV